MRNLKSILKRYSKLLIVLVVFTLVNIPTAQAQTPRPNRIFGEVPIEDTESNKKGLYTVQESQALDFANAVARAVQSPNSPNINISENALYYFTGLYLYCSAKAGACPFILDTLMSAEFLNAKGMAKKSCQKMKHFWELWIKNGFEERLPYLVPIGSIATMKTFNDQKRSRYIKCEESLMAFSVDEQVTKSVGLTAKLIEQLQSKRINVFEATGANKINKENN